MNKLCKDCKWCKPNTYYKDIKDQLNFALCDNPNNLIYTVSLISGISIVKRKYKYCNIQREYTWLTTRLNNVCGKEGRWYE